MRSPHIDRRLKRGLDLVVAGVLLVAALPLLVVSALMVALAGRTTRVIFTQQRRGYANRIFTMYKLRTMFVDADARLASQLATIPEARLEWHEYRRLSRDPRIVPGVGAVLRRLSIDELPQLWNVIRGDMSLIGPRPLELDLAARFDDLILAKRATVLPGMTGLWQVSGRSDLDLGRMIELDAEYVSAWSLRADIQILCRTPRAVLSRRGAF